MEYSNQDNDKVTLSQYQLFSIFAISLSQRPIAQPIGGSGGKSEEKSG